MIKKVYPKGKNVCKATFVLPKKAVQGAKKVVLLGQFNNWDKANPIELKKKKDGSFATTLELQTGRQYQFRYLIDGVKWENDWSADQYIPVSVFGIENSVVIVDEVSDVAPKAKKAKKVAPKKIATAKKTVAPKPKAVKKSVKDDLKKIEGIGPKIASLLNAANIVTFKDLASAKVATLKEILLNAGPRFKMHNPSTWAEQAQLAAKGAWAELQKLQDELKGGVKK